MNTRLVFGFLLLFCGCLVQTQGYAQTLRLATTTSTWDSGLLSVLLPRFRLASGLDVEVTAVPTGTALRLGRDGEVDVILVHAPEAEQRFVDGGHGVQRRAVMHNEFIVFGPATDPARIRGLADARIALQRIADAAQIFVSRGDDSGTHKRELELWHASGFDPYGRDWYVETGLGQAAMLAYAVQVHAYGLVDRGTWLARGDASPLAVLMEGDPLLRNPYNVIAIDPQRHPRVNYVAAMTFIEWLTGPEAQAMIREFRVGGQQLFQPVYGVGTLPAGGETHGAEHAR